VKDPKEPSGVLYTGKGVRFEVEPEGNLMLDKRKNLII